MSPAAPTPRRPSLEGIRPGRPQPIRLPGSLEPPRPAPRPVLPAYRPVPRPTTPFSTRRAPGRARVGRVGWADWLQYPLFAAGALAAAFNSTAGQIMVLIYGLFSLWRRLPARLSFGAALFVLLTIPLFQALGRSGIAENAAIYVYELLVIGTISAVIELRKSGGSDESSH